MELRNFLSGIWGDRGIIFRDQGSTDPRPQGVGLSYFQLEYSRWYTIANTRLFTFDLYLGVMFTKNVAEYPSHHVTHWPRKFEKAMSNE